MGSAALWVLASIASGKPPEVLISRAPETLHPLYAWSPEDQLLANLVHERLFEPDGKGGWRSDVVAGFAVDGTVVTVTLASVDWHDGRPLVAADVCATVERIKAADRPTPWTGPVTAHVAACIPDDRNPRMVRLTLAEADPTPQAQLAFPLVPAHRPEWTGAGPQNALEPVGLGAWSVAHDTAGWHLTGGKRAPENKLELSVVADPAKAMADGRGVALPFVAPADLPKLRSHPEITLEVQPASVVWALLVNPTRGPLGDPRVRAGLDLLIDRDALAAALYGRDPDLPTQPWTPVSGPFVRDAPTGVPVTLRDVQGAQIVLTEAGLVKTEQGWTFHGQPFALRVVTPLGVGPDPAKLQAALSQQLEGIRIEVAPLSSTQWWFSLLAGAHAPVSDLALMPVDPTDLEATLHARTKTEGLGNPFGWSDPQVDAWLDAPEMSSASRESLVGRLADLHPALFLWTLNQRSAWRAPYESLRPAVVPP